MYRIMVCRTTVGFVYDIFQRLFLKPKPKFPTIFQMGFFMTLSTCLAVRCIKKNCGKDRR